MMTTVAQVHTCLHSYLSYQICLQANEYQPEAITIADTLLLHHHIPHFHNSMPWLTREEHPRVGPWVWSGGQQSHVSTTLTQSTSTTTTTRICPYCKFPNATHTSFTCSVLNHCYYCESLDHHPNNCPHPHTNCHKSKVGCFVPYHHKNNHITHCSYMNTEWHNTQANNQEDSSHFNDVEATDTWKLQSSERVMS